MRILLIRPSDKGNINTRLPSSLNKRQGSLPPLGISYVASVLENAGHAVNILDVAALNLSAADIREHIQAFQPDCVGITAMTSTLFGALESARIAKELGAITVLGGPQLSVYPKETLSYPYVDYGINGEGEKVFLSLVTALEKKTSPNNIKGLIYKYDGDIFVNEPALIEDVDELPFPAYHLLPMPKYNSIISLYPVSTMISSRGCPYQCHFCFKQPADKKIRFRSPKNVVDEMEYLIKKYNVKEVMFYDDVLTSKRDHVAGICEEILSRSLCIKWESPARIDNVDKDLLRLMNRSGCLRLRYGVESGDENILKLMNKRISLDKVKEVFRWTRQSQIETFAYFMIGYAHETEETVKKTIDFAIEIDPDLAMFTAVTPCPATPLYELARKEGIITIDYWREFTLGHIQGERIPYFLDDAEEWVERAYKRFYFRPSYIMKQLSKINSLSALEKSIRAFRGILAFEMQGKANE